MPIDRETHGDVVLLRLNRPPVNALDLELLRDLVSALDSLAEAAPPVVLTGAGRSFCAGVDLRRLTSSDTAYTTDFLAALTAAFRGVFQYPAPMIAAINGHAIAGGYILAAACDHRVLADGTAQLGLSELRVGVPFPTEAIEIVRHALGTQRATELALGAALYDPPSALHKGFVDEVVPADQLDGTAIRHARTRYQQGPEAYLLAKRQLQHPAWENIARSAPTEDTLVRTLWSTQNIRTRIEQFMKSL
jgi:enoyl-CoA hydratase